MITSEEYGGWRSDPRTKKFFQYLIDRREDLKEQWGSGAPMAPEDQAMAFVYHELIETTGNDVQAYYEAKK